MNKPILYGIVGLVIGASISGIIFSKQSPKQATSTTIQHDMSTMHSQDNAMTMTDMVDSLKGKQGDEFDKIFISGMIEHHQGAIDMAKFAQQNAKHEEIKAMADAIISAQTDEIAQMREWQKTWGY